MNWPTRNLLGSLAGTIVALSIPVFVSLSSLKGLGTGQEFVGLLVTRGFTLVAAPLLFFYLLTVPAALMLSRRFSARAFSVVLALPALAFGAALGWVGGSFINWFVVVAIAVGTVFMALAGFAWYAIAAPHLRSVGD